jgi:catechol 2,3-dioxygenase-like lactoylglutathione lyase family enzyme
MNIAHVTLVVRDYDEAVAWYTEKLGFTLIEDTALSAEKRWVLVAPHANATGLLLAKAAKPQQVERVGDQTGGRVFLFLHTDNFARDYEALRSKGVHFVEAPRQEAYGTVAVFEDLYGNRCDLIERR